MMCAKLSKQCLVKRILVVSMTNIGDVVLSFPVIDILKRDFPDARMDVVVGKKAASLFDGNPYLNIKVFDKQAALREKYAWFLDLYRQKYDVIVDLRHTMLPLLLRPRWATSVIFKPPTEGHKKQRHLNRLRQVYDYKHLSDQKFALMTTQEDEVFFNEAVASKVHGKDFVVISPGAADTAKRWSPDGFAFIADHLALQTPVVFVGDAKDALLVENIQKHMQSRSLSLAGKIGLRQLAYVLKKSSWVLCHDSGVMHLACYLNVPTLVLWGPTNLSQYAPWGTKSVVIRKNKECVRCKDPESVQAHQCMSTIQVQDVLEGIQKIQHEIKPLS